MEQNIDRKALIRAAFAAREYAYTPYSNFKVGAALLAKTAASIRAATSNAPRSPRPTVPSVQPCLRL